MAALAAGRLDAVLPTLGVMAMAGYRLLPNIQMLYNSLHLVATNRFSLDELADELDFSSPSYPVPIPKKAAPRSRPQVTRALVYRGHRASRHHLQLSWRGASDPGGHRSSHQERHIDWIRRPDGFREIDSDQHSARAL